LVKLFNDRKGNNLNEVVNSQTTYE